MLGSEPSFSIWLRRAVETTYSELRSVSAISRLASSTWRRVRPKRSRICFSLNPAFSLRVTVVVDGITGRGSDIFDCLREPRYFLSSGLKGAAVAEQEGRAGSRGTNYAHHYSPTLRRWKVKFLLEELALGPSSPTRLAPQVLARNVSVASLAPRPMPAELPDSCRRIRGRRAAEPVWSEARFLRCAAKW